MTSSRKNHRRRLMAGLLSVVFALLTGCEPPASDATAGPSKESDRDGAEAGGASGERRPIVLYTSVDEQFARAIVDLFQQETGLEVAAVTDTEAGKTTGLLRRLVREQQAGRPRADVWWSSEVFGTIELAKQDVFAPYQPSTATDIPGAWKSPDDLWTATAARCRVLAYHTGRLSAEQLPNSWRELDPGAYPARLAIANPHFGTTRGHVAAMFAYWGPAAATDYLRQLAAAEALIADGNAHGVRLVAAGAADLCWTDTDDVWVAQRRDQPVDLTYPRLDEGLPALWIPCSAALVADGPNPAGGRRLIDFLVSERVEEALFASDSRNVPVRPKLRSEVGYAGPAPAPLDFEKIASQLSAALAAAESILLR